MKRQTYKAPHNAAERIAEARAAIARLRAGMTGDNRFGSNTIVRLGAKQYREGAL